MQFKYPLLSLLLILSYHFGKAQSGCTDPEASNYNQSAVTNDGSCTYPVTHYSPVLRAAFSTDIHESSGLIWTDGQLWTHNDSGNPASIFRVDTSTGATLQTVYIDNYPNTDWEDITADSNYIYVSDAGNNNGDRTDLKVLKIAKSDITTDSVVHLNAEAISFSYSDQTSFVSSSTNNYDCESIISIGDSLYIFTKDRGDLETRVYKMSKVPGTYSLSPYTTYNVNGLITGADYNPVTKEVALVGYMGGALYSFLWFLNDYQGDMFFSGNKRRIEIGALAIWQTEGITYLSDRRFFISCESAGSFDASLFIANKTWDTTGITTSVSSAMAKDYTIYPNPSSDILFVENSAGGGHYQLMNMDGQIMQAGSLNAGNNRINLNAFDTGVYILELVGEQGKRSIARVNKQ